MSESSAFKNYYNADLARQLAAGISSVYPSFNTRAFVRTVREGVHDLEFKDRIRLFSQALRDNLPADYPEAWSILEQILGDDLGTENGMFNDGFMFWPLAQFIEDWGLDHFDVSIRAMHEITRRHTAEFAIRPFLNRYPEKTLAVLMKWTRDKSPHVRRLVSEGTRPRLPWAPRLRQFTDDPTPTLALLEKLKDDESGFVRKSVANHLNDIGKDHPDLLLETAARWSQDATQGRMWIVRHALRSLVKNGHPAALKILGYRRVRVELSKLSITPSHITLGRSVDISFNLTNPSRSGVRAVVDYIVHHVKKNGETSPKVFKLKNVEIGPTETVSLHKNHPVRPITTRTYYPGEHRIGIQVNGSVVGSGSFMLQIN